jgi:cytochrome oxidase Cu insertion factor (SCO1/SenC/PrrC family)
MRARLVLISVIALSVMSAAACLSAPSAKSERREPAASSKVLAEQIGLEPQAEPEAPAPKAPAAAPAKAAETPKKAEYPLAELDIVDFDGAPVSLANLKGHWVLLDFFTTYAIPSQTAMPVLDRVWRAYKDKGLVVIGVSLDMQGEVMVAPFLEALHVTYPVYLAAGETANSRTPYGFIQEIPATLLIDPKGALIKGYLGGASVQELEYDLNRFMK